MKHKWNQPTGELRVCGLQARLFSRDWGENQRELLTMFAAIDPESTDLVITPEASNLYYHWDLITKLRGGEEEEFIAPFRDEAKRLRSHVLVGSLMVRDGDNLYNRAFMLGPDGTTLGTYDKMHLIAVFSEPQHLTPGKRLFTALIKDWRIGVGICYDLRFAEEFLNYGLLGCDLIALPSCWPDIRLKPWVHLHLARAQETQTYFVGVNHGGTDEEGKVYRMSMISSPVCEIVEQLPDAEPSIMRAVLNPGILTEQRRLYNLLSGRGPFPMGGGTVLPDELL